MRLRPGTEAAAPSGQRSDAPGLPWGERGLAAVTRRRALHRRHDLLLEERVAMVFEFNRGLFS